MTESRIGLWILAARPKTLWAGICPVIIGSVMAFGDGHHAWPAAVAALLGSIMIQIGTNLANDYADFYKGADRHGRTGPTRVTQAGLIPPGVVKRAAVIVFSLAGLCGLYLVWRAGWPIAVIGLLSILFGILYTSGPYPIGYHGLGDIFVLVFFGPVAVAGTYYAQALDVSASVLIAGLAPGLFSVAILTVNNLRDIDNDRIAGKRTLAARFGRTFARVEYLLAIVIGSSIPVFLVALDSAHPYTLATLATPIAAIGAIRKIFTTGDGHVLNDVLATTGKLLLLFSILFSVGWLG